MADRLIITIREAAELMGLSDSTVYRLARENKIPVVRIGSSVRVNLRRLRRTLPVNLERESVYRDLFAAQYGGQIEVKLRMGRADVVAPLPSDFGWYRQFDGATRLVVEVEPLKTWQHGIRQVLAYGAQMKDAAPALAVYGRLTSEKLAQIVRRAEGLCAVFALHGNRWELVTEPVDRDYIPGGVGE